MNLPGVESQNANARLKTMEGDLYQTTSYCLEHWWSNTSVGLGDQILRSSWTSWGSTFSEEVHILQHPEVVVGLGDTISGGGAECEVQGVAEHRM